MDRQLETRDLDEAREFMNLERDWEWEAYRVAPVPFALTMAMRDLNEDSRVERAHISGGLRMRGALRPGALYLGLYESADSRLVGLNVENRILGVTVSGATIDATTVEPASGVQLQLGPETVRRWFAPGVIEQLEARARTPLGASTFMVPLPTVGGALQQALEDFLTLPEDASPEQRLLVKTAIRYLAGQTLQAVLEVEELSRQPAGRELALRLEEMVRTAPITRLRDWPAQDTLCRALGVSRSTLQRHMKMEFGTHYAGWLRAVRLQQVRELILDSGPEVNITDLALSCGFWHLGRFSAYYRRMFGVLPSRQQARARG